MLCLAGIGYLFWADRGRAKDVSTAVWIPLLWMFFAASRYPTQWWDLGSPIANSVADYGDGSPMDRYVFLLLIVAGIWVLLRREVSWSTMAKKNFWILLFFVFAALSLLWADEPFVAFKRWVKGVGTVVMALLLLTEKRPYEALGVILRRLGFILLPLSVLFIKYFPELGRMYHMGLPSFTGITMQKNGLGQLCMLVAIYFSWLVLLRRWAPVGSTYRPPLSVALVVIATLVWLLYLAQSATAIGVTVAMTVMFAVSALRYFAQHPNRLATFGILLAVLVPVLDHYLKLKDSVIRLLGRQPDLTDRVPLWDLVLERIPNVWIGAGYESFWIPDRVREIGSQLGFSNGGLDQAHNGYIDLYANLGLVGVSLLLLAILGGLLRVRAKLRDDYAHAMLLLAFILMALLYNYTEAAFQPLNNVFVLLLFSILMVPDPTPDTSAAKSPPPGRRRQHSFTTSSAGLEIGAPDRSFSSPR